MGPITAMGLSGLCVRLFLSAWFEVNSAADTSLPQKGSTTGIIIGSIIGVLLLLAIIGTAIAMYRKKKAKLGREGPPKYKPPPPTRTNNTSARPLISGEVPEAQNYSTQTPEPVTDLDVQEDDVDGDLRAHDGVHYFSAAPSGWDSPANSDELPPYKLTNIDPKDSNGEIHVGRGESFISSTVIV